MEAMIRTWQSDPPSFSSYPPSSRSPSRAFQKWIAAILKKDPTQRLNIDQVLSHRLLARQDEAENQAFLAAFVQLIPDLDSEVEERVVENPILHRPTWRF